MTTYPANQVLARTVDVAPTAGTIGSYVILTGQASSQTNGITAYANLTNASLTLRAGVWLIFFSGNIANASTNDNIYIRLYDGSNVIAEITDVANGNLHNIIGVYKTTGTPTVTLQGRRLDSVSTNILLRTGWNFQAVCIG